METPKGTKLGQNSAFPMYQFESGMSKRFYAACAAMQGIISNRELQKAIFTDASNPHINVKGLTNHEYLINSAYEYADELLKQENL